jgi:hypothetical protein
MKIPMSPQGLSLLFIHDFVLSQTAGGCREPHPPTENFTRHVLSAFDELLEADAVRGGYLRCVVHTLSGVGIAAVAVDALYRSYALFLPAGRERAGALVKGCIPSATEASLVLPLLPGFIEDFSRLHQAQRRSMSNERHDRHRLLHAGSRKRDSPDDDGIVLADFILVAHLLRCPVDWLRRCMTLTRQCGSSSTSGQGADGDLLKAKSSGGLPSRHNKRGKRAEEAAFAEGKESVVSAMCACLGHVKKTFSICMLRRGSTACTRVSTSG